VLVDHRKAHLPPRVSLEIVAARSLHEVILLACGGACFLLPFALLVSFLFFAVDSHCSWKCFAVFWSSVNSTLFPFALLVASHSRFLALHSQLCWRCLSFFSFSVNSILGVEPKDRPVCSSDELRPAHFFRGAFREHIKFLKRSRHFSQINNEERASAHDPTVVGSSKEAKHIHILRATHASN